MFPKALIATLLFIALSDVSECVAQSTIVSRGEAGQRGTSHHRRRRPVRLPGIVHVAGRIAPHIELEPIMIAQASARGAGVKARYTNAGETLGVIANYQVSDAENLPLTHAGTATMWMGRDFRELISYGEFSGSYSRGTDRQASLDLTMVLKRTLDSSTKRFALSLESTYSRTTSPNVSAVAAILAPALEFTPRRGSTISGSVSRDVNGAAGWTFSTDIEQVVSWRSFAEDDPRLTLLLGAESGWALSAGFGLKL